MCLLKINLLNYSQSRTPEADYRFYTNAERKIEMMKSLRSYGNSEEMPLVLKPNIPHVNAIENKTSNIVLWNFLTPPILTAIDDKAEPREKNEFPNVCNV